MKSDREVRLVIQLFLAVLAFCVVVSLLQGAFGITLIRFSFWDYNQNVGLEGSIKRIPSVFWEAQSAGQYFAVAATLCLGAWRSYFKGIRWLPLLATAGAMGLLLTISRAAIAAFVVSIVVLQTLTLSLKKVVALVTAATLLVIFGAVLYENALPRSMKQRLAWTETSTTWEERYRLWTESLPIIVNNPLGVGLGGENLYAAGLRHGAHFISDFDKFKTSERSTHFENSFLQILYSLGIPGLLGFLAVLVKYFALGLGLFRGKDGSVEATFAVFLVGAMIAWLLCLFTSPLILEPQSMFVFVLLLALMNSLTVTHSRKHATHVIPKFAVFVGCSLRLNK